MPTKPSDGISFTRAIVRPPADTFAAGLTHAALGAPDLDTARAQHARYCATLEACGVELTRLDADAEFPDSTFVEDTAVVTREFAVRTRPGADSRVGEATRMEPVLRKSFDRVHAIQAPGTLDGGDVCQAGTHFFIGLSGRTNEHGATQLGTLLKSAGYTSSTVDMRAIDGILHLKSGISYLGENRLVLMETLAGHTAFRDYEIVPVASEETYAANFLRINARVIIAAGFPRFERAVRALGYDAIALDMSEFRKMDGALSCLSLRF
jgi:dimethylargininase